MQIFNICINPSVFVQILNIFISCSSSLWSVYKRTYILASGVRERDYCFGFCIICAKILQFCTLYVFTYIFVYIFVYILCIQASFSVFGT